MKPATFKTVQVLAVAIFSFACGNRVAQFSGSGMDWAIIVLSALAAVVTVAHLAIGFRNSNA
jgi:hypothetical protein